MLKIIYLFCISPNLISFYKDFFRINRAPGRVPCAVMPRPRPCQASLVPDAWLIGEALLEITSCILPQMRGWKILLDLGLPFFFVKRWQ